MNTSVTDWHVAPYRENGFVKLPGMLSPAEVAGLLSHGAGANMTRRRRIAMVCIYMPKDSTFNGNACVLPRDYLQTLKQGDVLENDDFNPIVGRLQHVKPRLRLFFDSNQKGRLISPLNPDRSPHEHRTDRSADSNLSPGRIPEDQPVSQCR